MQDLIPPAPALFQSGGIGNFEVLQIRSSGLKSSWAFDHRHSLHTTMSVSNFTGQVLPTFFDPWDDFSYTRVAGAALLVISTIHYYNLRKRDVSNNFVLLLLLQTTKILQISVPAVGPSGRFTSYYGAIKFLFSARAMLREGYTKVCAVLSNFKKPWLTPL